MAKYLEFKRSVPNTNHHGQWLVLSKEYKDVIATIIWHTPHSKWICQFNKNSIWTRGCLQEVNNFLLKLNK